jgi:hypothetical protein
MKCILAFLLTAACLFSVERLDIDPAIQGVWTAHLSSTDGGDTMTPYEGGPFARASAASILLDSGKTIQVERIIVTKTQAGKASNMMSFKESSLIFAVSNTDEPGMYLLQVFDKNKKFAEAARYIITIEK